jgi:hypothetical protein
MANLVDLANGLAEKVTLTFDTFACLLPHCKGENSPDIKAGLQLSYSHLGSVGELVLRLHKLHGNIVEQLLVSEGYGDLGFISGEEVPPQ